MNPILAATLRRNWQVVGAVGLFAVFLLAHLIVFQPSARRYERAIAKAADLGLALDPSQTNAMMPPRVFALVADNALPTQDAQDLGNSGVLTARLLEDMTRLLGENGMDVIVTEPGPVTQQSHSVQVRAHLKVRGRYASFVSLLDALARSGKLMAVDRFTYADPGPGAEEIDLWVSRLVLKQDRRTR